MKYKSFFIVLFLSAWLPIANLFATDYTLSVNTDGCETPTSYTYSAGSTVVLAAESADSCIIFSRWSDGNTDNPRWVTITSDTTFTPEFEIETYHTTIQSADTLMGKVKINTPPVISLDSILNIRDSSATFLAHIVQTGNKTITQRGFCVDIVNDPTIESGIVILDTLLLTDSFTCPAKGLIPNTTYYVRAFATNSLGTGYSETKSFTTPNCYKCKTGTVGTAVDLGLPSGTKWADHNVGASSPEGYGCYFAWGETGVKSDYSWATYSLCKGSNSTITKYGTKSRYGSVDYKTEIEFSDDAATVNWGGNWRMPTSSELNELNTQCTWTWTQKNGINGYDVKGPNGNSIFLPAAGYRKDTSTYSVGSIGYYWSSSLCIQEGGANYLYFSSSYHGNSYGWRAIGRSVRPVFNVPTAPQVKAGAILSLSDSTAQCEAIIVNTGHATITQQGFCVSTSPNPSLTSGQVYMVPTVLHDSFRYVLSGLLTDTTYYICAFATNSAGTEYSEVKTYKGSTVRANCEVCNTGTVGTAVDLGLPSGTKWADHNIGASSPEDYGCYFAWGETGVKSDYSWSTYSFYKNGLLTKYNTDDDSYGDTDNKAMLDSLDDAAAVNWGGNWHIPNSYYEFNELRRECTWTWTQKNGINGYDVKGPNGNSIFLPATGVQYGTSAGGIGSYGYYWSSSSYFLKNALFLNFNATGRGEDNWYYYYGCTVRPVCK